VVVVAVVVSAAAAAMEHNYNKHTKYITEENYYEQVQACPPTPPQTKKYIKDYRIHKTT
jgi:hypothetical protein